MRLYRHFQVAGVKGLPKQASASRESAAGTVLEGLACSGRPSRTRLDIGVADARRTSARICMFPVKAPFWKSWVGFARLLQHQLVNRLRSAHHKVHGAAAHSDLGWRGFHQQSGSFGVGAPTVDLA